MSRPDLQRIAHIREYCLNIQVGTTFEAFQSDLEYQQSVSFCNLQIGELCGGLSDQTVQNLFRDYDEGGIAAIKPQKRGRKTGEKRHLSPTQEQDILKQLLDHNPEQFKIKGCLWTRDSVRELIKRKYGIDMPIRTVGEYLRRWGLTVQRPARQAMSQKPEQVEAWLKEEYPAIHAEAKAENAEIFWGDETAVQNVANYALGYAPKGQTFRHRKCTSI